MYAAEKLKSFDILIHQIFPISMGKAEITSVIGDQLLTSEGLQTLLNQNKTLLNFRPL